MWFVLTLLILGAAGLGGAAVGYAASPADWSYFVAGIAGAVVTTLCGFLFVRGEG